MSNNLWTGLKFFVGCDNIKSISGCDYVLLGCMASADAHYTFERRVTMKRFLSWVLVLTLLLGIIPISALATDAVASGSCGDNLTWTLDENGILIISGNGLMWNWGGIDASVAPWADRTKDICVVIIEDGVTHIGQEAFSGCTSITSVVIPDSVTYIEWGAFMNCTSLKNVEFGCGVTDIDGFAFGYCTGLENVVLGDNVKIIHEAAFEGCESLEKVVLPSGLKEIWDQAFNDCGSLIDITVPSSVISIRDHAFSDCVLIRYNGTKSQWMSIATESNWEENNDFILEYLAEEELEYKLNANGQGYTVTGLGTCYDTVIIPSTYNGLPVTRIDDYAFSGNTSITSVVISDSVKSIAGTAFYKCSNLLEIKVDAQNAWHCDVDGVLFNKAKDTLVCYPIGKSESSYTIPNGVISVDRYAFACSRLAVIEIPESVASVEFRAFAECRNLTFIELPESVTFIDSYAFCDSSSLVAIKIPAGVATIEGGTFSGCKKLSIVEIPDSITTIGNYAFYDCSNLLEIEIPAGVTAVGSYAFSGCKMLSAVKIPSGVSAIEEGTFSNCSNLTAIDLPESVTAIRNSAFSRCSSLTGINLPESLISIGGNAFYGCTSLAEIALPENLTSISGCAFYDCSNLATITIPDGVTSIGGSTFCGCSSLTSIRIPQKVTYIGVYAFLDCSKLTSVTFEGNAPAIDSDAFRAVTATVNYPAGNDTWTEDLFQNYGMGTLTWVPYCINDEHTYEDGICTGCGTALVGPFITQQPESVQQEIGKKFAITVKVEGEGLTYQWYVKESGAKAFKLSSNKTSSYAYTMQTYMHNRQVYCVITDANGNSVTTETATITRPPMELKILQQPQDAQQEIGQKFSIKPTVQGDGLTYQWYYKEASGKKFAASSNKTSAYAYTMQSYMKGRQVYCVITDKYGNSVTTDVVTISLPPVELKILSQPSDVYAVKGLKFSIKPVVQGDALTYQWYYKESYQKNFSVSSNKTSSYAYAAQSYMNGRQVYCVITDQYGNQVQTEVVTIHIQ